VKFVKADNVLREKMTAIVDRNQMPDEAALYLSRATAHGALISPSLMKERDCGSHLQKFNSAHSRHRSMVSSPPLQERLNNAEISRLNAISLGHFHRFSICESMNVALASDKLKSRHQGRYVII
jgi:hypothetical protein